MSQIIDIYRKNRIQVENEEKFRDDTSRVNENIDENTFGNLKSNKHS